MKWCVFGSSAICLVLFALFLGLYILFLVYRSSTADYDSELDTCAEADVSEGDEILADSNSLVVIEEYTFILNDASLIKPCGDSGRKFDVIFQTAGTKSDSLITKFEYTEYDRESQLISAGKIYNCQGKFKYSVEIESEEIETETTTSSNSEGSETNKTKTETDWVMKTIKVYYSDESTLAAVLEIDDSREYAEILWDDEETVLASYTLVSETDPDFLIEFGDTKTSEYDTSLVYVAFGIWAFTDEIGATDLCFIVKYVAILGMVTFGMLFLLVLGISFALQSRKKHDFKKLEV